MSFAKEYAKLRAARAEEALNKQLQAIEEEKEKEKDELHAKYGDIDVFTAPLDTVHAPTKEASQSAKKAVNVRKQEKEAEAAKNATWFQKGAFDDGTSSFGEGVKNTLKTVVGTYQDVAENTTERAAEFLEHSADSVLGFVGNAGGLLGANDFQDRISEIIADDLINGEEAAEAIIGYTTPFGYLADKMAGGDLSDSSVLGDKADNFVQSMAHMGGTMALQAAGVPAWLTMGLDAYGAELESAYNQGASHLEANISAAISTAAEIVLEKLSGGIKFKSLGGTLDDFLTDGITRNIKKPLTRAVVKFISNMTGEGIEEYATEVISDLGRQITYMDDKSFLETVGSEDKLEALFTGMLMGSFSSAGNAAYSTAKGKDFTSGLTKSEESVVRKVYDDSVAEAEKDGKKLSEFKKNKLWDEAVKKMDNGEIPVSTIEEILGKNAIDEAKNNRLSQSYLEDANQHKGFEADESKYKSDAAKATIRSAIEAGKRGKLNNGRSPHALAEVAVGISDSTGYSVEFSDTEGIKAMKEAEGDPYGLKKQDANPEKIRAFISEGQKKIVLNMDARKSLNSLLGHEITDALRKAGHYGAMQRVAFKLAETKGELDSRRESVKSRYAQIGDADIDGELTSDIVGDYLFTDENFVKELFKEDRNLFQKIYDEIKYFCKLVTAGTKEARQLEQLKHTFEKVWREGSESSGDTKYSVDSENSIDKEAEKRYNLYTESVEYQREVTPRDKLSFPRRLANGTSDMVEGDYKLFYIRGYDKIYCFSADGYMHGQIVYSKYVDNYRAKERNIDEYDKIRLDKDRESASLWPESSLQDELRGYEDNSLVLGRGRTNPFDTLPEDAYERYTSGYTERDREAFETKEEREEIIKQLKKLFGWNDEIAPINEVSSTDDAFFDGKKTKYSLSDSDGKQITKEQSEYFKDSKVRDENGNLKVMYHGTPNGDFTVFKDGTYFTDNKEYADLYQNPGASSISTKKSASAPKTFEVYLNIKKPFDINDAEARKIYINDYIKGGNAVGINPYLSDAEYDIIDSIDWTEGEDLREFLIDNDYDYDGLVLDEGATGGYGDDVNYRGKSYVVFSSEQVKNVDNTNPTSNPDIHRSLAKDNVRGESPKEYGKFNVYTKDVRVKGEGVAPVAEDLTDKAETSATSKDTAPMQNAVESEFEGVADAPEADTVAPALEDTKLKASVDNTTISREDFKQYSNTVYEKIKALSSGKYHEVDGYGFHLIRAADGHATITIKTPDGNKLQKKIDDGKYWKNKKLWREAAEMLAKNTYPNVEPITAEEARQAKVLVDNETALKPKRSILTQARNKLVDKYSVFEDTAIEHKNPELDAKANFMRYSNQRAQYFMTHGENGVRPFLDLKAEVTKSGLTQEFFDYLYEMLNTDRMSIEANAVETLKKFDEKFKDLRPEQIYAIAAKKITNKTTEKTAQTIRDAREYTNALEAKNLPVFGFEYTADMSKAAAEKAEAEHPEFKRWAQEVYDIVASLRKKLVEDGEISQETADKWAERYPHYVPITREGKNGAAISVPLDTNKTGVNAPIKRAKGGNSNIEDLWKTIGNRIVQTYVAGARNSFGVELMNTLGTRLDQAEQKSTLEESIDGIEEHEERLKKGSKGQKPTFTVFDKGKRVEFEITEDMYDALKPTEDLWTREVPFTSSAVKAFKKVTTEYSPKFMFSNPPKDLQAVLINSQHPIKTYTNYPAAVKELSAYALGKDAQYASEYLSNGGEDLSFFDSETKSFDKEDSKFKKAIGYVPRKIGEANQFFERATRLAEYIASRKDGASVEKAMLDAARVTTNFAAGGDVTKFVNRNFVPFLNPSVQGAAQQVRNIRQAADEGLTGCLKLAGKYAAASIPVLIFNALVWGDDEEYEELSDYVKENYYIVAKYGDGKFVRIPKGREVAVIQNAVEQVVNMLMGEETDWKGTLDLAKTNIAPSSVFDNNIFAPIRQVKENKSWFGEEIVPSRLQDLPEAEQFDETTDAVSKWLGEKLNISPKKMNYLLDQYTGGIGDAILPYLTPESDGGGVIAPLKDLFVTDSVLKNQNISDFYDTVDELTANAKSSKATDEDILKYKYINSVRTEISELYKQKREIQNSDMSDKRKSAEIRKIQEQIVSLARESLNAYEDVNIEGEYAYVGDRVFKLNGKGEWQKASATKAEESQSKGSTTTSKGVSSFKDLESVLRDLGYYVDSNGNLIKD